MDSIYDIYPISQISTKSLLSQKNTKKSLYTTNIKTELPIFLSEEGNSSLAPKTMMDLFEKAVKENLKDEVLFSQKNGEWVSWTWNHFNKEVRSFAKGLVNIGISPYKSVNILGNNSPEWFSAFLGGIYACVIPVGIYNTFNSETCLYIAEHSDAACIVLDSLIQYRKYEKNLYKLKSLKAIIFYCNITEIELKSLVNSYCSIYSWQDFINMGKLSTVDLELNHRIKMQKPGNCCNIVYTSGTTDQPKAVMLSHDNMTWNTLSLCRSYGSLLGSKQKIISFNPLSHIAGQIVDIVLTLINYNIVYFAKTDAFSSGTLVETIRYVNPDIFYSVPRVYEKFEEKIRFVIESSQGLKRKIADWSMRMGTLANNNRFEGKSPPFLYSIPHNLFHSKIREALGFSKTKLFFFGAAPMKKSTIDFFRSLNIPIFNNYGLSETSGPLFINIAVKNVDLYSAGIALPGTMVKIKDPDDGGNGEIICRGRNRFMGYLNDEISTNSVIDEEGYLHTGDVGYINKKGFLIISGRAKELIVTSGGENIAPLPIENMIRDNSQIISNVIVIGDNRNYLSCLITLKSDNLGKLNKECLEFIKSIGSDAKSSIEAMNDDKVKLHIQGVIDRINLKAISKVQRIKKWIIIPLDFSLESGEMTPTMKLKKQFIINKFGKEIESMYSVPKY